MRAKEKLAKKRRKDIEEIKKIYLEIRNDPIAMRQVKKLVAI